MHPEPGSWQSNLLVRAPAPHQQSALQVRCRQDGRRVTWEPLPTFFRCPDIHLTYHINSLPGLQQRRAFSPPLRRSTGAREHSYPDVLLLPHSRAQSRPPARLSSPPRGGGRAGVAGSHSQPQPVFFASFGSGHLFVFLSTGSPLCDQQLSKMHLVVLSWDSATSQ